MAEIKFFAGRILQGLPEKEVLLCKAKSCIAFCFCLVGLFAVAVAGTGTVNTLVGDTISISSFCCCRGCTFGVNYLYGVQSLG